MLADVRQAIHDKLDFEYIIQNGGDFFRLQVISFPEVLDTADILTELTMELPMVLNIAMKEGFDWDSKYVVMYENTDYTTVHFYSAYISLSKIEAPIDANVVQWDDLEFGAESKNRNVYDFNDFLMGRKL